MKYLAAYLLNVLGGAAPTADNITKTLEAGGATEVDSAEVEKMIASLADKVRNAVADEDKIKGLIETREMQSGGSCAA